MGKCYHHHVSCTLHFFIPFLFFSHLGKIVSHNPPLYCRHIYRLQYSYMKFTLDWTLIQMLLTQKLTMYCFDIHDGTQPVKVAFFIYHLHLCVTDRYNAFLVIAKLIDFNSFLLRTPSNREASNSYRIFWLDILLPCTHCWSNASSE